MKILALSVVSLTLLAGSVAFASGSPSSLDCFSGDKEISLGLDSTGNDTDNVIDGASFMTNTVEGQKNKKSTTTKIVGYLEKVSGDRSDSTATVSYKDDQGNKLTVHADNGAAVKNSNAGYTIRYGAKITVELKDINTQGANAPLSAFPKGTMSGACLYNPGS